jgi:hypothetical protein
VEETVGHLHDVVLREAGHGPAAVGPGIVEGVADDPLRARPGDQLQALVDLLRLPVLDARIEVLLVLPHDHHVHGRVPGGHMGRIGPAGAHIGEEAEPLPDGHVEALEAAALRGGDRGLEQEARAPQPLPGVRRDAGAHALAVGSFADLDLLDGDARPRGLQDAQGGVHDLGADAVAAGHRDGGRRAHVGEGLRGDMNVHGGSPVEWRPPCSTVHPF